MFPDFSQVVIVGATSIISPFLKKSFVNSQQQISPKENECLENLLTNLGTISKVSFKNSSTLEYDFCNTQNTSQPIVSVACYENQINSLKLGQSNSYVISDDFLCFDNLIDLSLNSTIYNSTFYSALPQNLEYLILYGNNLLFSQFPPSLNYFYATIVNQTIKTTIKFSYLKNLIQFSLDIPPWISLYVGSHLIYFENDLDGSEIWESDNSIFSMNIPSLRFIKGRFDIKLHPDFLQSSLSNIPTMENITSLSIISGAFIQFPSFEFSQIRCDNLKLIWFDSYISSVPSIIDLSSIGNSIESLGFTKCGRNFQYGGGLFPFILPKNKNFKTFSFSGGYIQTLDLSLFNNVEILSLENNVISGSFPSVFNITLFGKLKNINIADNKITGTIDDSFCSVDLYVRNNLMNGTIPSCFTCFLGLPNFSYKFFGNNFTNYYPSSTSTIIPNFMPGSVKNFTTHLEYEFFIFGENLGGSWIPESLVVDDFGSYYRSQVLINNKLIRVMSFSKLPDVISMKYSPTDPNYSFKLSTRNIKPLLEKVDWQSSTSNLVFDGSFFTYNKSIVNITIGSANCFVTSTSFNQISCTISNGIGSFEDVLSYITIGNLTTQFTLNPGLINTILNCSAYNDCNGNGYCLSDIGKCKCDSTHQGDDCSLPYIDCNPLDCNGNGICSTSNGKCHCDLNHQGDACELPLKQCLNNCNNVGQCNNQTSICSCQITPFGWTGNDCSIPLHTISAISPSDTNGGYASIYGWFGNIHTDPQVFIGNKQCIPIYNISQSEINCNAPPGTGLKSVSVIQNSINVTSKDIYQYYSNERQCPNHCTSTSNGICNTTTGYCNCIGRWSGYDCSLYSNPSGGGGDNNGGLPGSNTTIDGNTGNTNITNQQTNYQILITKLIEIDFNGNQINEYLLLDKWSIISNISKTVYTFIQSIQNDKCNITYTIEEINKDRDVSFAGISFKLTSGSVKMTVSIENYQYSSNLNTLQLQMKSSVNEIQTNDENDCNDDQIEINSTPNQDNSLNYIAIKKDAKVLNGRFIDRIESDGISTFMQTVLVSKSNDSITVGMNLPHCTKKCLLDPDFSVLISPEFIDECSDNNRESWFLPVVIAVPVGGLAAIIAIVFTIYKKRFVEAPLKRKLQRFSSSAN
ncbi:hypothetical protein ACTFIR_005913 [Dictyostelium discoideum]